MTAQRTTRNALRETPNQGATNEWLTPPEILAALGPFDLDPCAPVVRPWDIATRHFTVKDDGLSLPWHGFVWLNPPYGPNLKPWLAKMAEHNNGIALTFARTETAAFQDHVWPVVRGVFFPRGRIKFCRLDGAQAPINSAASSVMLAFGDEAHDRLAHCSLRGQYLQLRQAWDPLNDPLREVSA